MVAVVSPGRTREFIDAIGEVSDALAGIARSSSALDWMNTNEDRLARQYPQQWIAVASCSVVAHAATLDELHRKLSESAHRDATVRFIAAESIPYFL